jgi:hypothetical protein
MYLCVNETALATTAFFHYYNIGGMAVSIVIMILLVRGVNRQLNPENVHKGNKDNKLILFTHIFLT